MEDNWATVETDGHTHRANLSLVKNAKIGDYLLVHNELALNKVPRKDALKILDFLENRLPKEKPISKSVLKKKLTRAEVIHLLKSRGKEAENLFSEANKARQDTLKEFICIHGIIEFSNYCKNDCLYCGLRSDNKKLRRYRIKPEEIIRTAEFAVNGKGYKLLVLQSGEDYFYSDEMLADIVRSIKEKCRVFVFVSIGERGYACYRKLKEAGASGVLFRFETSNLNLFKKLHPNGKNLGNRLEHLKFMKELGYFIATGSLIGLPGQSIEDLADDIFIIKKWANMVSMGPYVPMAGTPLGISNLPPTGDLPQGDKLQTNFRSRRTRLWRTKFKIQNSKLIYDSSKKIDFTLKMIAILRLLMPQARIPVTTAFETLAGEEGRRRALASGANSLMFNLTPAKYRPLYKIYGNKFYQKENFWEKYGLFKYEESYKMLEERMVKEINKGRK